MTPHVSLRLLAALLLVFALGRRHPRPPDRELVQPLLQVEILKAVDADLDVEEGPELFVALWSLQGPGFALVLPGVWAVMVSNRSRVSR
jgi:hypothetical protein